MIKKLNEENIHFYSMVDDDDLYGYILTKKVDELVNAVNSIVPKINASTIPKEPSKGYGTSFSYGLPDKDNEYYKEVAEGIRKWLAEKSNEQVVAHLILSSASSLVKLRDCIDSAIERLSKGAETIPPL